MTEQLPEPTGHEAARLLYAAALRQLADLTRRMVPTERGHYPSDWLHEALYVQGLAQRVVDLAVVVERTATPRPTSWEALGDVVGISRQSAQARWGDLAARNDIPRGQPIDDNVLATHHVDTGLQLAEQLDAWCRDHIDPGDLVPSDRAVSVMLLPDTDPVRRATLRAVR